MKGNLLVVGTVALACTITVVAVLMLATEVDVPSETAVPLIVVVLLAVRFAARRNRAH